MKWLAIVIALALASCTTVPTAVTGVPNITRTQVYELKAGYTTIRAALAVYRSQPYCSDTQPAPCQTIEAAKTIKQADNAAMTALTGLERVEATGDRVNIFNAYQAAKAAIDTVAKIKQIYGE